MTSTTTTINVVAYNAVAERRTSVARYADGTRANLREEGAYGGQAWISKGQECLDSLQWEFECLVALQDTGLVPEVDVDLGCESRFFMVRVNNAATLAEYAEAAAEGEIPVSVFRDVCKTALQTLEEFWDLGWVHGDLHSRNLVVSLSRTGKWEVLLIDLEFAITPDGDEPPVEQSTIDSADGDAARLLEDLHQIMDEFNAPEAVKDVLSMF